MFKSLSFTVLLLQMYCLSPGIGTLIVPDEVPSLLSLVYSNIPPIKKGTDSRLGWGFRLGNHADFQVLVELGPQTNTKPLGNEPANDENNKRDAPNNFRNTLYAQMQLLKQQREREKERQQQQQQNEVSKTDGGQWIQAWSETMTKNKNNVENDAPQEGAGEISAASVIPAELEELYGVANKNRKS